MVGNGSRSAGGARERAVAPAVLAEIPKHQQRSLGHGFSWFGCERNMRGAAGCFIGPQFVQNGKKNHAVPGIGFGVGGESVPVTLKKMTALPGGPLASAGGKRGRACCSGVRASAKQGEKGDQDARACGVATGPQAVPS